MLLYRFIGKFKYAWQIYVVLNRKYGQIDCLSIWNITVKLKNHKTLWV